VTSLLILMGAVCLAPVLASVIFVVLTSASRTHRFLVGSLGALFGFLLGLIAVFCGVMLPLSSLGLSGRSGNGTGTLVGALGLNAGIAALAAVLISIVVTRGLAKAISNRERGK
jgi:hypothetical protein